MADSTVKVSFLGDASSLKKASDDADGHLSKIGHSIGNLAKAAAVGFAAAAAGAAVFAKSAIDAASNLAESQGKVNVVFKEQAKEIDEWASKSAKAFGQSKQSALEAVGTYGNLFSAFGIGSKQSAKMSKSLVELAADLASFNNTSVDEALLALRSGLSGEAEPLKKFGVALTDQRLKLEAVKLGLIKTVKEGLTPAAKAQASYSLIMKDTALAQGDFARTSDGLANKQRILKATFSDIQAEIGTRLLPIMVSLSGFVLEKLLPAFQFVSTEIAGGVAAFVGAFKKGDGDITSSGFPGFLEKLGNIARDVFEWMRINVPPILAAIGEFINIHVIPAVLDLAHWINTDLRDALGKMIKAFKEDLWPILEEKIIPKLRELGNWIKTEVAPRIGALAVIILEDIIPAFFDLIKFIDEEVVPKIMAIVGPIAEIVKIVDKLTSMLFSHGGSVFDPLGGWNPTPEKFVTPGGAPVFGPGPGEKFVTPGGKSKFAVGGVVGGPLGVPRLAIVHGGERITPPGQANGGGTTVIFELDGKVLARAIVNEGNVSGGLPLRIRAAS